MQNLLKLYERQEIVIADLRSKLRQQRHDATTKDKQLELAHRTIERLAVDKNGLEAGDAAKKSYIRQLESRVVSTQGSVELQALCNTLQADLESLRAQITQAEDDAAVSNEKKSQAEEETRFLRRGIQLAAEQLSKSTGNADISATLLMAVARGQNEAAELSSQLAESQAQMEEMTTALSSARAHLQTQYEALKSWKEWEVQQTQQLMETEELLKAEKKAHNEVRRHVDAWQGTAAEARRERDAARHRLEVEKTARQEAESKVHALQHALRQSEQQEQAMRREVARLAAAAAMAEEERKTNSLLLRRRDENNGDGNGNDNDGSLDALERELRQLLGSAKTGVETNANAVDVPLPLSMKTQSPAGRLWRVNPLAREEEEEGDVVVGAVEEKQKEVKRATTSFSQLSEEAAWRLLERNLEGEDGSVHEMRGMYPTTAGLHVDIEPQEAASPGIASSSAPPHPLKSPDLGPLSARNAMWLNSNSINDSTDQELIDALAMASSRNSSKAQTQTARKGAAVNATVSGGNGVQVQVYAGIDVGTSSRHADQLPPPPQRRQPPRQLPSLMDIARMDIEY